MGFVDAVAAGQPNVRTRLLKEPARPSRIRESHNAQWFAVATVCIGAFMGQLDASIVTLAFPALQRSFGANVESVTWVGLTYLLVLVASVAAVGRVSDIVGRKLVYTYGFAVFIAGSALCGLAPTLLSLDGFRVIQAIGAAMLQANSAAIIYLVLPRELLGRGIGLQGAAQAAGLAFGPAVGGLLTSLGGWRLVFYVNVPAGLVGIVAACLFIPRSRHLVQKLPFDWAGLALFVPAVAALMATVSFARTLGITSPVLLFLVVTTVVLLVGFTRRELRTSSPLIEVSLLRRRPVAAGLSSALLAYVVMFGMLLVTPFFLERGLGSTPGRSGLELTAMPVALAAVATFVGRAWAHSRPWLSAFGMIFAAGGALALVVEPDQLILLAALAAIGGGLGLFVPSNTASVMTYATKSQAGAMSGVLNMTRGLGTALGLAIAGAIYDLARTPKDGLRYSMLLIAAVAATAAALSFTSRTSVGASHQDQRVDAANGG
jgi:EmrB/QacA subfamily drug resistance transporter